MSRLDTCGLVIDKKSLGYCNKIDQIKENHKDIFLFPDLEGSNDRTIVFVIKTLYSLVNRFIKN